MDMRSDQFKYNKMSPYILYIHISNGNNISQFYWSKSKLMGRINKALSMSLQCQLVFVVVSFIVSFIKTIGSVF